MSELDAARKCRDLLLRKEAGLVCPKEKAMMTVKIKEMQMRISLLHRKNKGL